jgi:DNA-binding XRE family transcriptional regulator
VTTRRRPIHVTYEQDMVAREIAKALNYRKVMAKDVAKAVGITPGTFSNFKRGATIPSMPFVAAIADVLSWPNLILLAAQSRRKTCPIDGQPFIDNSSAINGVYCSRRCRTVAQMRVEREVTIESQLLRDRRLGRYESAVEEFCTTCSPDLICPDKKCPLQKAGVSPLRPAFGGRVIRPPVVMFAPRLRKQA